MANSSLWLLPPSPSDLNNTLTNLINSTIPSSFPTIQTSPIHLPHITLTSDVPSSLTTLSPSSRQRWLSSLPLSLPSPPVIRFSSLESAARLTKKLSIHVSKVPPLTTLATQIRSFVVENGATEAAERWVAQEWVPHLSLLYADTDISEAKKEEILRKLNENWILLESNGQEMDLEGEGKRYTGWVGGRILWMDTTGEITDWEILGERDI